MNVNKELLIFIAELNDLIQERDDLYIDVTKVNKERRIWIRSKDKKFERKKGCLLHVCDRIFPHPVSGFRYANDFCVDNAKELNFYGEIKAYLDSKNNMENGFICPRIYPLDIED